MARVGKVRVPKVQVAIDDRDHGYKRMVASLGSMDGGQIELGIFGPKAAVKHPDANLTVGQLATLHEFGLGGQEPRPAIGQWTDQNEGRIHDDLFSALRFALAAGMNIRVALEALGQQWVHSVRDFILAGQVRPANAPSTIEEKGHARPLVGLTGALSKAVDFKVTLHGSFRAAGRAGRDVASAVELARGILDSAAGIGGASKRIRGRK